MPRPSPVITAETAPLEVLDDGGAQRYVRATKLLRLARVRRDARLKAETTNRNGHAPDAGQGIEGESLTSRGDGRSVQTMTAQTRLL